MKRTGLLATALLLSLATNAFLVGFIESIADFGNPVVVGGSYAVLSTDIFFAIVGAQFDQGKAASLALVLTGFALAVFFIQQRVLGRASYTTVSGKGDAGMAMPLPDGVRRLCVGVAGPWLLFTVVVYVFAFIGGFVQTWGRDYTPTLAHFRTAFDLQWGTHGLVWAGTAWNSLFTTVKLAALAAPLCAALGLLISWLIALAEYLLQVPANRIGFQQAGFSVAQLKIIQEVITLSVFVPFATLYLGEGFKWDFLWAALCMVGAVYFVFRGA